MIILTPKDYAAADIATLPSQRSAVVAGNQADAGQDSSASNGPNGGGTYRREVAVDKLTFESDGSIRKLTPSSGLSF